MAESPESELQGLNLQDTKQTNGLEYMNGNGVNSPDKMDDFEAQFQPVPAGKPAPGLDPNAAPFQPFGEQSDLSNLQASDQSVPANDLTQPTNTATDQQIPPDQPPSSGDGVLIDFGGKDEAASSSPAPSKGEGHIDPFSMDVGQMDHSASEGGQPFVDNTLPQDTSATNGVTSPANGTEEEKAGKRTPSASSKKKYGIDSKNTSYKPGGGQVKIFDKKVQVKATPRIDAGAKTPTGSSTSPRKESPRPKPTTPKGPAPNVKNVTSRIGSLQNTSYTPGGGQVRIATKKTDYSTVTSKVGSTANMDHKPGGGEKKTGGKKIESHKVEYKAQSKVGSTDYITHKPGGGQKKIETQKLDFKDKAKPRVESKTGHKPGGGDKKIETQKVNFKESAKSRTDTGNGTPKLQTESANSQDS